MFSHLIVLLVDESKSSDELKVVVVKPKIDKAPVDLKPNIDEREVVVDSKPNIAQIDVHVIDMSECSIYNR
jgi:hypothetical protein